EEQNIVALFQFGNGVRHALGIENADGIGGQHAAGYHEQIFDCSRHDDLFEVHVGGEIICQSDFVTQIEQQVLYGTPQVGIDNESGVAALRTNESEVGDGGG